MIWYWGGATESQKIKTDVMEERDGGTTISTWQYTWIISLQKVEIDLFLGKSQIARRALGFIFS